MDVWRCSGGKRSGGACPPLVRFQCYMSSIRKILSLEKYQVNLTSFMSLDVKNTQNMVFLCRVFTIIRGSLENQHKSI
jgi:hypothetical protein